MRNCCLLSALFSARVKILRRGRVYVAGRAPGCDILLPSDVVSRRHAELEFAAGAGIALRDRYSKNGTMVNGERVDFRVLRDRDQVAIGPFTMEYREVEGDLSEILRAPQPGQDHTRPMSAAVPGAPQSLTGTFDGDELLEVCQLLALHGKDGTLHVQSGDTLGRIELQGGRMTGAAIGLRSGEEAVIEILSQPSGMFEFVAGPVAPSLRELPTANLILEAARRRDEAAHRADEGARRADEGIRGLAASPGPPASTPSRASAPPAHRREPGTPARPR